MAKAILGRDILKAIIEVGDMQKMTSANIDIQLNEAATLNISLLLTAEHLRKICDQLDKNIGDSK